MVTIVRDAWRMDPLVWIHRAEAGSLAAELAAAGLETRLVRYGGPAFPDAAAPLLRLSDPVMHEAVQACSRAGIAYIGPAAPVMARCYDKYEACRLVGTSGVDVPRTALGSASGGFAAPFVAKPRRGSDSIGLRLVRSGVLPANMRTEAFLVQEYVAGEELTVAVMRAHVGTPVRIVLPEGTPYSFARKYLLPTKRVAITDGALIERVREIVGRVAALLGVDWAARIDFIRQRSTGRLFFLECDAAPLIGASSVFATSLAAGGIDRARQLRLLLNEEP